jgi:hypothetical protein
LYKGTRWRSWVEALCCKPGGHGFESRGVNFLVDLMLPSRGIVVGVATAYRLDDRGVQARIPIGSRIFTSLYRPDRPWGPHDLLSDGYWETFPRTKAAEA